MEYQGTLKEKGNNRNKIIKFDEHFVISDNDKNIYTLMLDGCTITQSYMIRSSNCIKEYTPHYIQKDYDNGIIIIETSSQESDIELAFFDNQPNSISYLGRIRLSVIVVNTSVNIDEYNINEKILNRLRIRFRFDESEKDGSTMFSLEMLLKTIRKPFWLEATNKLLEAMCISEEVSIPYLKVDGFALKQ